MSARTTVSSRWFVRSVPRPHARVRLFCFPFAGGGASVYRGWGHDLPDAEVVAVQLPGREDRYGERAYTQLPLLTADLAREIEPLLDGPFALLGHSMGASIAYQLALDLEARGRSPALLILSARPAPHLPLERPLMHGLSDERFVAELRKLEGTPALVLENQELMDFLLPTLRADFELCDTFTCPHEARSSVPLLLFGGIGDTTARREQIEQWREYTTGPVRVQMFPGNHFFVQTQKALVIRAIDGALREIRSESATVS